MYNPFAVRMHTYDYGAAKVYLIVLVLVTYVIKNILLVEMIE